jgi:hypothetical protein
MRAQPKIEFSGVRSSCDTVASNSSFAVFRASARRRVLLARQQSGPLLLQATPLADVSRDLEALTMAAGVLDGRDRDRYVDVSTVLGLADGLEVIDALAAADPGEDVLLRRAGPRAR